MIKITVYKDAQDTIQQLKMLGHAQYADPGYDIVCAAVSSQVISVENSLQQLLKIAVETKVDEVEGGFLHLKMPAITQKQLRSDSQLLLNHLVFALQVLAENYPEFIKIQESTI